MSALYYYVTVVILFGLTKADNGLVKPCHVSDIKCLSQSTEQFLEQTHKGIPQFDIQQIDPLVIDELNLDISEDSAVITLKKLEVKGLRTQKISDFKMDVKEKSVQVSTSADIEILSDVVVEIPKKSKTFNGKWTAKSSVTGKALYDYKIKTDDKGVDHFDVGPETIEAKIGENVQDQLHFDDATKSDADFNELIQKWQSRRQEVRDKILKKIVKASYVKVVANIRASAKVLPKSAFFVDV